MQRSGAPIRELIAAVEAETDVDDGRPVVPFASEVVETEPRDEVRLLMGLAERVGVEVRLESLDAAESSSAGGLCRLKDRLVLIVDRRAPPAEQAGVLLDALATLDLDSVFVPPALRRKIERRKG